MLIEFLSLGLGDVYKRQSKGWTLVTVDESVEFANIEEWIEVNIRDEWRAYDNRWVFKDSQEALLFKMRWA